MDTCISCGCYLPEGYGMVCKECEKKANEKPMTKEELIAQIVEELSMIADDFKTYGDRECAVGIEEAAEYIKVNYLRGQGE